jgi:uncharacterized phiE125 gp8 family phage protein
MWNNCWGDFRHPYPYTATPLSASVVVVGRASAEIVTLDAMRTALKVNPTDTSNDDYIKSLILSARHHAERHTHRSLSKKAYLMSLSRFPNVWWDRTDKINLWYPPLRSDISIKYIDTDGAQQTLASGSGFQVDFAGEPGRVAPLAQTFWPQTKFGAMNAVQIFYTAGYEAASSLRNSADAEANNVSQPETETVQTPGAGQVSTISVDRTIPNDLVLAIKQIIMHWYQNRVPIVTIAGAGGTHSVLPWHLEKILDDYIFDTLTPTITPEF